MRIISIACRNINSLRGAREHRLDFEAAPLEGCGLFAITGPTGAGKTTLLDAITLALYNQTPRQKNSQALLSHGATEGWAEVVYEVEAGRFLSRWSVQRAHKKREGTLQTAYMEVCSWPDGKVLVQKSEKSIRHNVALTGLDYDQFTRSVLLAQGGFAEFLKAKDDERAGLLERMTGTAIYKQLSKQAHERKVAEEKAEELLATQLGFVSLLSEAELAEKHAAARRISQEVSSTAGAADALKQQHEWHQKLAELGAKAVTAAAAIERADQARAAEQAALDQLAAHESVEQFEETWIEARNAEAEVRKAEENRHQLDSQIKAANTLHEKARQATAEAHASWQAAEQALAREKPALTEALNQLPLLQKLTEQAAEAATAAQAQQQAHQTARQHHAVTERQLAAAATDLQQLSAWLQAHSGDAQLTQVVGELKHLLDRRQKVRADYAERSSSLRPLQNTLDAAAQKEAANQQIALDTTAELQQLRAELLHLAQHHAALLAAATAREARLKANQGLARSTHDELRRQLLSRELFADHAANLVPGHSCPLCGSLEHPILARPLDTSVEAIEQLQEQVAKAEELLATLAEEQTANHALLALLTSVAPPLATPAALPPQEVAAATRSAQLLVRDLNHAPTRSTRLEGDLKLAQATATDTRQQQAEAQRQITELKAKLAEIKEEGQALNAQVHALAARFGTVFDLENPGALATELQQRQAAYEAAQARQAELEAIRLEANAALNSLREKHEALAQEVAKADDTRRQAETERAQTAQRIARAHPGYSSPQAALRHWESTELAARQVHEQLRQAETQAAERPRTLQARHADQVTLRDDAMARARILTTELREGMQAAGHDPKTLRLSAVLLPGPERPMLRALKARLDGAVASARAIQQQLAAELTQTQARALSTEPAEVVQAAFTEAQANYQALHDQLLLLNKALADDEASRAKHAGLAQQLSAQRAETRRWRNLHELIGHSDGTKFSRFAQGLTLARLVALANQHLSQFNDRYQLGRRDDSTLGLLVADSYDDCTRDVSTLSGGETFLVSLALALGLAELASANAARLDSLFIDEGFGTLDADTLDVALAALGSLRQRGKTIGIITHVHPDSLRDYIDTQVVVERIGQGTSRLRVLPEVASEVPLPALPAEV